MIPEERPREKLLEKGPANLSDHELLAAWLGSGRKGRGVLELSYDLLQIIDKNDRPDIQDLRSLRGLGPARIASLLAIFEFVRRRVHPRGKKINGSADAFATVSHYADRKQEHFFCMSLNGAHEVIRTRVVSIGLLNRTMVHPREVFADPITDRAAAIIVAHNHPSGDMNPSPDDHAVTERLKKAGEMLGVRLLDHIVFSDSGYFSFADEGIL